MKKSFTLDINLSAVEGKSATAKTQVIRKLFSGINGFGGATIPSKFEGIIQSTFTSSESIKKTMLLARANNIIVNSNLKRQGVCSDWAILIRMWQKAVSFLIGKDSVCVAKAVRDHNIWVSRDRFRALLFTLLVKTTAYDLSNLLDRTSGRTCIINCLLNTSNRVRCAVVGFKSENDLNSAFFTKPVFGGVRFSWARLDLVWCKKCGHLGHLALECDASDMSFSDFLNIFNKRRASGVNCLQLAKLYTKKNVPISRPATFGDKSWAQVVSLASPSGGSPSGSGLGIGFSPHMTSDLGGGPLFSTITDSSLNARLASLECSFELLADQVSGILRKLSFVELVPMVPSSGAPFLVGSVPLAPVLDSNMALDDELASSNPHSLSVDMDAGFKF
ncbi:hypothetical protein G9A89_005969 [Geosiphon pyriformis]|nr:hypothetical protein G9A89_005969 [Geosiphon pyriformis]